jgi:hypothetical protein
VAAQNMNQLPELFASNPRWASGLESRPPGFFAGRAAHQGPRYLAAAGQLCTRVTVCSSAVSVGTGARRGDLA